LIEGILTFVIGVFSFVLMPAGATQTASWFRGKQGWFSEHEEYIMVNRILRDDPSKGDMNNRTGVSPRLLWKTITDWEQWPLYLIGLMAYIPPSPPTTYLSYILRQLGFSTFQANMLLIPSQFFFAADYHVDLKEAQGTGYRVQSQQLLDLPMAGSSRHFTCRC
jgi:hypothetical protein